MSDKQARGTKRSCQSCNNRFYDLNRDPIVCPICSTPFVLTAVEVAAIAAEVASRPKPAKPTLKEKVFALPDTPPDGDETPPDGDEIPDMESTEALAEIEGEEAEIADDETADTFLEPEEGDEADVSGLIEGPAEGEEET